MNTYTGAQDGDRILLAPALPGDISVVELQNDSLLVQSGSYLASSEGVQVDTKWSGAKTFFGSEGLIMLRVSGTGTLIVSSYGAIHPMELAVGEKFVVDTGHLVTFDENIGYDLNKVAGWKSTLFSGEGLVAELTGPGDINLQTRSQDSFFLALGLIRACRNNQQIFKSTPRTINLGRLGTAVPYTFARFVGKSDTKSTFNQTYNYSSYPSFGLSTK